MAMVQRAITALWLLLAVWRCKGGWCGFAGDSSTAAVDACLCNCNTVRKGERENDLRLEFTVGEFLRC